MAGMTGLKMTSMSSITGRSSIMGMRRRIVLR
jgi:hypothetical protein